MCNCKEKHPLSADPKELEENLVMVKLITDKPAYYRGVVTKNVYGYRKPEQIFRVMRQDAEADTFNLEIV